MADKTSPRSQDPRGSKRKSTYRLPREPANDLVQATRLARRMITRWGMGTLGPVAFDTQDEQPFLGYHIGQPHEYSEATAARDRLDALVESLLREETLAEEQLVRILGPRPAAEAPPKPERQPLARPSMA